MDPENPILTIPVQFVDYRRRLIAYGRPETIHSQFDRLFNSLKKFGVDDAVLRFEIGNIVVNAFYLHNDRFEISEIIDLLQPDHPDIRLERDVPIGILQLGVNDPLFRRQWALRKMQARGAWARVREAGKYQVTVAIVDSGIKRDHEDFTQAEIDAVSVIPWPDNNAADHTGHGTMLAGTIAAITGNRLGIAGEAPNLHVLSIKFTDAAIPPTALLAVLAIVTAISRGAKVINASWHVLEDTGLLKLAIEYAGTQGCAVVAAAGNDGSDNARIPTLPASWGLDSVTVALASDEHDDKAWFSNYGVNVDVAAPGTRVLSTGLYYLDPAYREYSGTSPAAAHVSGAAALLLAIDNWTPQEIRDHLVASADPVRRLRRLCRAGGRLNLCRAVRGPFSVVSPAGGEQLQRGTNHVVEWQSDYVTPVVNSIAIEFRDVAGDILSQVGGLPNNGAHSVVVPNQPTAQAFVRIRCEQKNLYADSGLFRIV